MRQVTKSKMKWHYRWQCNNGSKQRPSMATKNHKKNELEYVLHNGSI